MLLTQPTKTFPSVSLPSLSDGLPVEVALIAQLIHGSGDHLKALLFTERRPSP